MRKQVSQMNRGIKLRLAGLGLAVGLLGALIVLATIDSEKRAREVKARLSQVDTESFRIADRFKDQLREANDNMRRYASGNESAAWQTFLDNSEGLRFWMVQQGPGLTTDHEKQALQRMESALDVYLRKARELHERMEHSGESGASLAEYNEFQDQARHFFDQGQGLARAHFESRNEVLSRATRTLRQLRLLVLGLVELLLFAGAALAVLAYRDLIAPLRVRVVESEALAERNEKLASLGLLAAGVAHEIRNPLTAIKAALFLQQKNIEPGSTAEADASRVEREILRLEKIVNGFLQFARPAEPELASLPADLPLQEVQVLLAEPLSKANIRLVREESTPLLIQADAAQIKQVLINLVQNAAESMNGSGTITLRTRQDRKRLARNETDVVILEVADTGKGIAPEVERRLFDPFFTTKETGTGLGLSIAARIVEKHGGDLEYQTQPNHGTTFRVVLPQAVA